MSPKLGYHIKNRTFLREGMQKVMLFHYQLDAKMKSTNIEIRKITFNKFEFTVHHDEVTKEDGKATISVNLPDRET